MHHVSMFAIASLMFAAGMGATACASRHARGQPLTDVDLTFSQGEELFVDVPPLGPPLRLRYQGAHEFATPEPDARQFRFEPADGPIERVVWEWGEIRAFARRVQQGVGHEGPTRSEITSPH